ncbi:MAG: hypothetical protein AAF226_07800 [Verrucomicrobiota bacterium]
MIVFYFGGYGLMRFLGWACLALIFAAAFVFAARFEAEMSGDLEWGICFGVVFLGAFMAGFLTKKLGWIVGVAALAPLSTLGVFFIVNMMLSAITALFGAGLAMGVLAVYRKVLRRG